jgi:hypothetical protein
MPGQQSAGSKELQFELCTKKTLTVQDEYIRNLGCEKNTQSEIATSKKHALLSPCSVWRMQNVHMHIVAEDVKIYFTADARRSKLPRRKSQSTYHPPYSPELR